MILKRTIKLLKEYLRMNNLELTDTNNYRLNEINKMKKLNKYKVSFDYLDNIFIALSA